MPDQHLQLVPLILVRHAPRNDVFPVLTVRRLVELEEVEVHRALLVDEPVERRVAEVIPPLLDLAEGLADAAGMDVREEFPAVAIPFALSLTLGCERL